MFADVVVVGLVLLQLPALPMLLALLLTTTTSFVVIVVALVIITSLAVSLAVTATLVPLFQF